MKYQLVSRTLSADGSEELLFAQKINSFDENYPVQIMIKTLALPPHFREGEELVAEYNIEFRSREVQSIDGRPIEDVFESAGDVRIIYK